MKTFGLLFITTLFFSLVFVELSFGQLQENDFERQVRELVNQERQKANLKPLAFQQTLFEVARRYSETMLKGNFFSHTGQDGSSPFDRMNKAGYKGWFTAGENIAKGYPTPDSVMKGWMNSPGHRANILNPSFNEIGVGLSSSGFYWTQAFGARRGVSPSPSPSPRPTPSTRPAPRPTPSTPRPTPSTPRPSPTTRPAPRPTPPTLRPTPPTPRPTPPTPRPSPTTRPAPRPTPPGKGLTTFYYAGKNFEQFKAKTVGMVRIDNPSGSPFTVEGQTVPGKDFSVKYYGLLKTTTGGLYQFQTISDDGIRLTVAGLVLIRGWTDRSATTDVSRPITLAPNRLYPIYVEYYNNQGPAVAQLNYKGPGMNDFVPLPADIVLPDLGAKP